MSGSDWPRVLVHPGTGVVDRRGDVLLVVPAVPTAHAQTVRELLDLCHRSEPTGSARVEALRALIDMRSSADLPDFALLVRTGAGLRAVVHGSVQILVDGRAPGAEPGGARLAEHLLEDGTWDGVTIAAGTAAALPDVAGVLPLDLHAGTVLAGGVTLHRVTAGPSPQPPATGLTTSSTQLRPAVRFRSVLLGECAVRAKGRQPAGGRRPPLPVAAESLGTATADPEVLVDAVQCPAGHVTDPDRSTCLTCGSSLAAGAERVRLPRPPLGIVVTDGGTIYTVTGDFVVGREAEQAPDVLAGRARPLPLRDAARSTSRVHARLTVRGWAVLLSDERSANGTFVSHHGAVGPWLPVTPQAPLALAHGDRVRLGKRQLLFDAWREAVVPQVFR